MLFVHINIIACITLHYNLSLVLFLLPGTLFPVQVGHAYLSFRSWFRSHFFQEAFFDLPNVVLGLLLQALTAPPLSPHWSHCEVTPGSLDCHSNGTSPSIRLGTRSVLLTMAFPAPSKSVR